MPKADAPVVAKLREAGAIVIGKTNMHELAFGISGYNPRTTPARRRACVMPMTSTQPPAARRQARGRARRAHRVGGPGHRHRRLGAHSLRASTPVPRCAPPSAAIRKQASLRSRIRATRPARWPRDDRRRLARPRDRRCRAAKPADLKTGAPSAWSSTMAADHDADTRSGGRCRAREDEGRRRDGDRGRHAEAGRIQRRRWVFRLRCSRPTTTS